MASCTKVYEIQSRNKHKKMGRKRKNKLAKLGSTPTRAEVFGDVKK
jgi:hypothetical protein